MAFIDEVFKANSAILNTLLTILNERLFDNGAERVRVPLVCLARTSQPCLLGRFKEVFACLRGRWSVYAMAGAIVRSFQEGLRQSV